MSTPRVSSLQKSAGLSPERQGLFFTACSTGWPCNGWQIRGNVKVDSERSGSPFSSTPRATTSTNSNLSTVIPNVLLETCFFSSVGNWRMIFRLFVREVRWLPLSRIILALTLSSGCWGLYTMAWAVCSVISMENDTIARRFSRWAMLLWSWCGNWCYSVSWLQRTQVGSRQEHNTFWDLSQRA